MARSKVYQDTKLQVEAITPEETVEVKAVANAVVLTEAEFTYEELADLFASWVVPVIDLGIVADQDSGSCKYCGKVTRMAQRCVCMDCMNVHGKDLYAKLKEMS